MRMGATLDIKLQRLQRKSAEWAIHQVDEKKKKKFHQREIDSRVTALQEAPDPEDIGNP